METPARAFHLNGERELGSKDGDMYVVIYVIHVIPEKKPCFAFNCETKSSEIWKICHSRGEALSTKSIEYSRKRPFPNESPFSSKKLAKSLICGFTEIAVSICPAAGHNLQKTK